MDVKKLHFYFQILVLRVGLGPGELRLTKTDLEWSYKDYCVFGLFRILVSSFNWNNVYVHLLFHRELEIHVLSS